MKLEALLIKFSLHFLYTLFIFLFRSIAFSMSFILFSRKRIFKSDFILITFFFCSSVSSGIQLCIDPHSISSSDISPILSFIRLSAGATRSYTMVRQEVMKRIAYTLSLLFGIILLRHALMVTSMCEALKTMWKVSSPNRTIC